MSDQQPAPINIGATSSESFQIASLASTITILVLFGVFAVFMSWKKKAATATTENFITARKSQGLGRTIWSFYGASVGAWAIFLPASYATFAGIIGLVSYAVAAGLPIFVVAIFGNVLRNRIPHVLSLSDFAGKRFGTAVKYFVILLTLFNMSIALVAEFTAIGSLFQDYVGVNSLIIIIIMAAITILYTSTGGLMVSIITDQWQAIFSVVLLVVASIFLAVQFRFPLTTPLPENLGPNEFGYSSIASMPLSLLTAAIFSEAVWQRVWASESKRTLIMGGSIAFALTTCVVFLFGFFGFLGAWAGLSPLDETGNLSFFVPFAAASPGGRHDTWIQVILVILTAVMNESAIDSLQNAIVATFTSNFLMEKPVWVSQVLVVVLNIPIVVVATQNFNLLNIFFVANILTSTSALPLMLGVFYGKCRGDVKQMEIHQRRVREQGHEEFERDVEDLKNQTLTDFAAASDDMNMDLKKMNQEIDPRVLALEEESIRNQPFNGAAMLFGCFFSFLAVCVFGIIHRDGDFKAGMNYAFLATENGYDYRLFLVAIGFSAIGTGIWVFGIHRLWKAMCGGSRTKEVVEEVSSSRPVVY